MQAPLLHTHGCYTLRTVICPCRHVTASDVHTFLVIDRSGSMGSMGIQPDSREVRKHKRFSPDDHDTVLGVVYEAVHKYVLERAARAPHDIVTFVPFNDTAIVDFAGWHVKDPERILDRILQTPPNRGTNFANALGKMQHAVAQVWCLLVCAFLHREHGQQVMKTPNLPAETLRCLDFETAASCVD